MNQLLIGLFIILTAALSQAAPSFCVQHFNAYGPVYATHVKSRTERFTTELMSETPLCDVVQLIEVWNKPQINQIMTAMGSSYSMNTPNLLARNGLMTLVHGPIDENQTFDFAINKSTGALDRIRGIANVIKSFHVIKTQLPQVAEPIYFVSTHLHPTSQAIRLAQILDLFQWRLKNQNFKMILSGDFNADRSSLERSLLMSLLAAHDSLDEVVGGYTPAMCTYCEENPHSWLKGHRILDYIFFSNISSLPTALKVTKGLINLKGIGKKTLSDHYGVRAVFELSPRLSSSSNLAVLKINLLRGLAESFLLLQDEEQKIFAPYVDLQSEIYKQVNAEQGIYWDYFSQYY